MEKCPHEEAKILYKPIAEFQLGFSWSTACPWHPAPEPQTSHMSVCPGPGPGPVCLGRLLAPQGSPGWRWQCLGSPSSLEPLRQVLMKPVQRMEHSAGQLQWGKANMAWDSSCLTGISWINKKLLWVCSAAHFVSSSACFYHFSAWVANAQQCNEPEELTDQAEN